MATPFPRTLRSLAADGCRPQLAGLLVFTALLLAWLAWFVLAEVTVYEVSDEARLEADIAAHPIDAPALGRIVATRLLLGREVQAGEVLVELDADAQRFQLEEEGSRLAGLGPQLEALGAEAAAEERSLAQERQASLAALEEARAKSREAEALARIAEQERERAQSLHAAGNLAELDLLRSKAESERRRAAAESLGLAVERLGREQRTRDSDRMARIESLRREATRLEGLKATTAATVDRLKNEIERRRIRAPVSGRIGEVAELRVGSVVDEAQRLAAIVPPGELRVVAEFLPPAALGRIRPGQKARLRLEGFPWAQYGSLAATVSSVGSEIRGGRVRVELAVHPDPASAIPLQHGLPGAVEVNVERLPPASLVLRAAGRLVAGPGSAPASSSGGRTQR
jgi:membrane fusion protein (multidrug efflux system)